MRYTPFHEFRLNAEDRMERKFERIPLGFAQNPRNSNFLWRIYYADATKPNGYYTVSNVDYPDPEDAPADGVICILQYMQDQEVDPQFIVDFEMENPVVVGELYFINENGRWQAATQETLDDRDTRSIAYSAVKNGYWTDLENYRRIMEIAAFDTDFPTGMTFPEGGE